MGMSGMASGSSGGGRRRRRGRKPLMSEINVTPFVDVMLVLLIIFMVAAPLLTVGVPIDLPETQAKPLESEQEPITFSINAKGEIYLQDTQISADEVVPKLTAIADNGTETRVFVRGEKNADYGTVMQVMARISASGFKKIGLVTAQENN
jgi:biopolymer transport protein TolR